MTAPTLLPFPAVDLGTLALFAADPATQALRLVFTKKVEDRLVFTITDLAGSVVRQYGPVNNSLLHVEYALGPDNMLVTVLAESKFNIYRNDQSFTFRQADSRHVIVDKESNIYSYGIVSSTADIPYHGLLQKCTISGEKLINVVITDDIPECGFAGVSNHRVVFAYRGCLVAVDDTGGAEIVAIPPAFPKHQIKIASTGKTIFVSKIGDVFTYVVNSGADYRDGRLTVPNFGFGYSAMTDEAFYIVNRSHLSILKIDC